MMSWRQSPLGRQQFVTNNSSDHIAVCVFNVNNHTDMSNDNIYNYTAMFLAMKQGCKIVSKNWGFLEVFLEPKNLKSPNFTCLKKFCLILYRPRLISDFNRALWVFL